MSNTQNLLNHVNVIVEKNREILEATGGKFNIFNVIGIASDEVRLHSAILAELFRSDGSHGLKDKFLNEFIKELKDKFLNEFTNEINIERFDCQSAKVEVEKSIGTVTDVDGGRIDILIIDKNGFAIIIENKIYAGDQNAQLIRYDNYGKKNHFGKYAIIYLTLSGIRASKESSGDINYTSISYQIDIAIWLENCLNIAVRHPLIRETINQYITLIKQLTGQSKTTAMKEEIVNLLVSNASYLECTQELILALNFLNEKVRNDFFILYKQKEGEPITLKNNHKIFSGISEDGDGVYMGFSLKDEFGKPINKTDTGIRYSEILKRHTPTMKKNEWWFGWFNPTPFEGKLKFNYLNQQLRAELYSDSDKLDKFVDGLIEQRNRILSALLIEINK